MKNILFRADASSTIGTGHIMRDLVLAKQYTDSKIIFSTQELEGNLNARILESGYQVKNLLSNELDELVNVVKEFEIDMIIIDHYEIDYIFEKKLKEQTGIRLMVLDDTYEKHHCDILLNHNINANEKRYKGLVPYNCELRCGTQYTLLRDEFIEEKKKRTIFLAMGGADHSNINIRILEVLNNFSNIEVNLVTTTSNQNLEELQNYVEDKKWIKLHINSNEIARLMKMSDFAIVTPSVTLNEIFYMKIPFVAIKTADNQYDMYEYLINNEYDVLEEFNSNTLKNIVYKLINKSVEFINFIDLSIDEKKMILEWRNDKSVRKWMFTQELVSLEHHLEFINGLSFQKNRKYFLLKQDGQSIGVIDFTNIDFLEKTANIGLYAKPYLRGVGGLLMQEIINYAFCNLKIKTLISEVFNANVSAIKLYKRFYFQEVDRKKDIIIMELKNENR